MKKRILLATVFCIVMMASGCNSKNTDETAATGTEVSSETSAETTTEAAAERPDYTALDYVTLGQYKGLEVTLASTEPTDEEIETQMESQYKSDVESKDKMEKKETGTVADGDVVNIDYEGKVDGEAFEGGTDKGFALTIGSNSFIEGFESGLIGVEVGKTVDLDLKFPDEYQSAPDLAGKAVVFTVTVNHIQIMPEMTDSIIAEISEFKTIDEYRDNVKSGLVQSMEENQKNQQIQDLMGLVYNNSKINGYPQDLIDYNVNEGMDYYTSYAEQSGITLAELIEQQFQTTEDEFKEQMVESIKQSLDQEMLIKAIVETEGLTLTDKEFSEGVEKYATQYQAESSDAFLEQYGEPTIRLALLQDKALELVTGSAVITQPEETESETASEE